MRIFLLLAISLLTVCNVFALDATLTWDACERAEGYTIYYRSSEGLYSSNFPIDVGNVLTYTVGDLPDGSYCFSVDAYNSYGRSALSNEVCMIDKPYIVSLIEQNSIEYLMLMQTVGKISYKLKNESDYRIIEANFEIQYNQNNTIIIEFERGEE